MNDSMSGNAALPGRDPVPAPDQPQLGTPEIVSALMDGRLKGDAFVRAVEVVQGDRQLRTTWLAYHVVGELLRQGEVGKGCATRDLSASIAARLAAEPIVGPAGTAIEFEPADAAAHVTAVGAEAVALGTAAGTLHKQREAVNDPVWRWRAFAGVATAAALGTVGWNLWSGAVTNPARSPVLAQGEPPQQMLRDQRLDELLAAHEQSAGISALQMPAGFLRNATFEGRGR